MAEGKEGTLKVEGTLEINEQAMKDDNLTFWLKGGPPAGEEVLRFEPNGDIYVRGKLTENDKEVVEGLREFLSSWTASKKLRIDIVALAQQVTRDYDRGHSKQVDEGREAIRRLCRELDAHEGFTG